jgi:hypothetical protein
MSKSRKHKLIQPYIWPEWVELNDGLWWVEVSYGENKKDNWLGELAVSAS